MLIPPVLALLIHSRAGLIVKLGCRDLIFIELVVIVIVLVLSACAAEALTPKSTKN